MMLASTNKRAESWLVGRLGLLAMAWALDLPPTEAALMDRLHELVTSDPVSAVGLAAQGDLRFPGSPMSEERVLLAIRALVNLHMYGAAQVRAQDYYSRYPD